jgi:predicted nucleotidyltransferase
LVDLRTDAELAWLASLVRAVDLATSGAPWLVAGAMARDLLFSHAHGIRTAWLTRDVDIAIAVESWEAFHAIRAALIRTGRFAPLGVVHKLQYEGRSRQAARFSIGLTAIRSPVALSTAFRLRSSGLPDLESIL